MRRWYGFMLYALSVLFFVGGLTVILQAERNNDNSGLLGLVMIVLGVWLFIFVSETKELE